MVDHREWVMAAVQGGGIAGTCPGTTPVAGCTMMVGCGSGMAGASGILVDQQGTVGSQEVCQQMECAVGKLYLIAVSNSSVE